MSCDTEGNYSYTYTSGCISLLDYPTCPPDPTGTAPSNTDTWAYCGGKVCPVDPTCTKYYWCNYTVPCATNDNCCLNGTSNLINAAGKTVPCNPNNTSPSSSSCVNIMLNYCAKGDRLFTDPKCYKQFCPSYADDPNCIKLKTNYCDTTAETSDSNCIGFCTTNACPVFAENYCTADTSKLSSQLCRTAAFDKTIYGTSSGKIPLSDAYEKVCAESENWSKDYCQCFLPTAEYNAYYSNLLSGITDETLKKELVNAMNSLPSCNYPKCATDSAIVPRWDPPYQGNCPAQCISVAFIDNNGNIVIGEDINISSECSMLTPPTPQKCSDANSCPSGYVCDTSNGTCNQQCNTSSDCQSGTSCINGICGKSCTDDNDCTTGYTCQSGVCKKSPALSKTKKIIIITLALVLILIVLFFVIKYIAKY